MKPVISPPDLYDVVIVGGGPAGLNAALVLGRCRRTVLVVDHGRPRNAASSALHGFLTRDGTPPYEFLRMAREELRPYPVTIRSDEVRSAFFREGLFNVVMGDGTTARGRKLLLATGVRDKVPEIPGIAELYGCSVHHCPYCDGWEWRDARIAVHGRGASGRGLALSLTTWSSDVILCTDGPSGLKPIHREQLERHGIRVHTRRIARLNGEGGKLRSIVFSDGSEVVRDAMFFSAGQLQSCDLAVELGCRLTVKGAVWTNHREGSGVPGLYVAGDASRDVQFIVTAAAEGAKAAVAINTELQREEELRRSRGDADRVIIPDRATSGSDGSPAPGSDDAPRSAI